MRAVKVHRLENDLRYYLLDQQIPTKAKTKNRFRKLKKLVTRGMDEDEAIALVAKIP